MFAAQILEAVMLICFGLSWPINACKNYKAETAAGTSWQFILLITLGYVAGVAAKVLAGAINWVLIVYFLNLVCIGVNWAVYFRNCRLDREHQLAAAHEHEVASIGGVVVATDGSPASLNAINFALHSVNLENVDEVNVVSAVEANNPVSFQRARHALDVARDLFGQAGIECKMHLCEGQASTAIVKATKDCKAGLVIMGSRGYSGVKSLILGSTSKAVTNSTACPVLIVKQRTAAKQPKGAAVPQPATRAVAGA